MEYARPSAYEYRLLLCCIHKNEKRFTSFIEKNGCLRLGAELRRMLRVIYRFSASGRGGRSVGVGAETATSSRGVDTLQVM